MPEANAEKHVAGIDVIVAGAKLDPTWRDLTLEVKVVDSLTLPDMALVRLSDPKGDKVDSHPLQLGKDLEIKASSKGAQATTSIFKGQIAAVEPEFTAKGCVISVRAYDKAHKLNRQRKTRTFQQVSASRHGQQDRGRERPLARRSRPRASSTSSSSRATRPTGTSAGGSR